MPVPFGKNPYFASLMNSNLWRLLTDLVQTNLNPVHYIINLSDLRKRVLYIFYDTKVSDVQHFSECNLTPLARHRYFASMKRYFLTFFIKVS